jgi:hypothetical protein
MSRAFPEKLQGLRSPNTPLSSNLIPKNPSIWRTGLRGEWSYWEMSERRKKKVKCFAGIAISISRGSHEHREL